MPIVKAQCTNCGGVLEVDNAKEAAICPFCNTPYIVEKAINNYSISNKFEIQNADIKIVGEDIEQMLANADTLLNVLKRYDEAETIFKTVTQKKPDDYRGWWGLLMVATKNFSASSSYATGSESDFYRSALAVAPDDIKNELIDKYTAFDTLRKKVLSLQQDIGHDTNTYDSFGRISKVYWAILVLGIISIVIGKPRLVLYIGIGLSALSVIALLCSVFFRKSLKKKLQQLNSELKSINKV